MCWQVCQLKYSENIPESTNSEGSLQCLRECGNECIGIVSRKTAFGGLGPHISSTVAFDTLFLVLEASDFEAAGAAFVSIEIDAELCGHSLLDKLHGRGDLGLANSHSSVLKLDRVGCCAHSEFFCGHLNKKVFFYKVF